MYLTKEEERLILRRRKDEESKLPRLIGKLKHDLYSFDPDWIDETCRLMIAKMKRHYISKIEIDKFFDEVKKALMEVVTLDKGTKFVCFFKGANKEFWCDDAELGIEDLDANWAKDNLIDIKPCPKS